jgi:hypothetical protein
MVPADPDQGRSESGDSKSACKNTCPRGKDGTLCAQVTVGHGKNNNSTLMM